MKKTLLTAVIATGLSIFAFGANASSSGKSTISLGYAQSSANANGIKVFKSDGTEWNTKQHGLNLKYRYELDDHFGVVGSLTYTLNRFENDHAGNVTKFKSDSYSLLAGPSYRFNDYISAYGMIGAAHNKIKIQGDSEFDISKTSLAYGAGLQFNPIENIAVDASYQYSKFNDIKVGTWVLGIGYSF
ncbi:Ail/Lom family outer membrane beta-barrel protein [Xenorhabdus bovienii]|uniref:Ail/Lom family outer membrane beta-barrel protein n=1 Tax=Xenorhabdus bovienii TaxID=40576 RepID=UPI003DA27D36